jgi:pSer/pThr/pTyr-binding forkhead associated (FHA) protein
VELPHAIHRATAPELRERIAAERRGLPFLLYRDADGTQRIVGLERERVTLGRHADSDVALPWDPEVSRVHAELERIHDEWTLVDDGRSSNGSFLNGDRVSGRRRLRDGDVVRVGRTLLVFRSPGRESVRTAPADAGAAPVLTDAQRRVLVAVCRPFTRSAFAVPASTREIADELVVSVDTVKTHLRALFAGFGVEELPQNAKRAELARRAFESGAVGPGDFEPPGP